MPHPAHHHRAGRPTELRKRSFQFTQFLLHTGVAFPAHPFSTVDWLSRRHVFAAGVAEQAPAIEVDAPDAFTAEVHIRDAIKAARKTHRLDRVTFHQIEVVEPEGN